MREHVIGRRFDSSAPEAGADFQPSLDETQVLPLPEANDIILLEQLSSTLAPSEEKAADFRAKVTKFAVDLAKEHPVLARDGALDIWAACALSLRMVHPNFALAIPEAALQYQPSDEERK